MYPTPSTNMRLSLNNLKHKLIDLKLKLKLKLKLNKERTFSNVERMMKDNIIYVDDSRYSYLSVVLEDNEELTDDDCLGRCWFEETDVDFFWSLDGDLVEDWFNSEWP